MSNPEADRNPDLITGLIIGSKSLFAYSERAFFKGGGLIILNPHMLYIIIYITMFFNDPTASVH